LFSEKVHDEIFDYLLREGARFISDSVAAPSSEDTKPFHVRLMPIPSELWARFSERSFSTRSGGWWNEIAYLIARDRHASVKKNYLVSGQISAECVARIERMLDEMDQGQPRRDPSRSRDLAEIVGSADSSQPVQSIKSKLFVLTQDGHEIFFNVHTTEPNKKDSRELKRKILMIHALRDPKAVQAYACAAYNPAGDGFEYRYPGNYAGRFLDLHTDLLVGREFWEVVGDLDTYDDLLEVAEEVGAKLDEIVRKAIVGRATA
jgi:hypothetical protein